MEKFLMIAGHGGAPYDPGATGNGYEEANLTRDLAERIVQSSRTAGLDITLFDTSQNMVQVYRNGGTFPFQKYDMCLEIHFNASALESSVKDGKKKGTMFYTHSSMSKETEEMGQRILDAMIRLGSVQAWDGLVPSTAQFAEGLSVQNRSYSAGCEHLLLEVAFISDADDVEWYMEHRDAIASSITDIFCESAGISRQEGKYIGMVCNVPEGDKLNVRSKPENGASLIAEWPKLSDGNLVEVLENLDSGWVKIRIAARYIGYVFGDYLVNVSEGKYLAKVVNVPERDSLNVRVNPGNEEPLLKEWPRLSNGNVVEVLGAVGNGWMYVKIAAKYKGYVFGTYLERI